MLRAPPDCFGGVLSIGGMGAGRMGARRRGADPGGALARSKSSGVAQLFITMAADDAEQGEVIADALRRAGHRVTGRADLPARANGDGWVRHGIDTADGVIVLWSPAGLACRWVRRDAERALIARRAIPVLIDPVESGAWLRAGFTRPVIDLSGWLGAPDHAGWQKLTRAVAGCAAHARRAAAL